MSDSGGYPDCVAYPGRMARGMTDPACLAGHPSFDRTLFMVQHCCRDPGYAAVGSLTYNPGEPDGEQHGCGATMHISETHIAISGFICIDEEIDGQSSRTPKATAFQAAIPGKPFGTVYVVTASHVIECAGDRRLYLRVNTAEGFDDIEVQRDEWFIHDHSDVAIVRVKWTGEQPYRLYSIYPDAFVRADYALQSPFGAPVSGIADAPPVIKVEIADQVSIIGLFVQHFGQSKSLPIVRTGTIARMPSAPIRFNRPGGTHSEQIAYLVELHSHGGLSGSPVYVHRTVPVLKHVNFPIVSRPGQPASAQSWVQGPGGEIINFLGLISGHFDIDQMARTAGDIDGTITVAINSGIAVVTPAEAVRELLWREDVLEDRLKVLESAEKARTSGSHLVPESRIIIHHKTELRWADRPVVYSSIAAQCPHAWILRLT
jgi:hypothetical protein